MQRGRPRGSNRRALKKWEPKRWRAKYDIIIEFHVQGYKHKEIADMIGNGCTPQTVMNVVTCEAAQPFIIEARNRQVARMANDQNRRLEKIQERALAITERVLFDDKLVEESPLSMLDKSMKILAARGTIRDENTPQSVTNNTLVLSSEVSERLVSGLEKANAVKALLNGGKNSV
jgi:hypothetical protein